MTLSKKLPKQVDEAVDRLSSELSLHDKSMIANMSEKKLVRVGLRGGDPLRISVFNENERYGAVHLGKRFRHAQRRDKIRKAD